MKPTELMIFDWVYNTHNRKPEQVAEIGSGLVMLDYNDLYEYNEIEPIPLTGEILKANGFRREGGASYWHEGDRDSCILHWSKDKTELIVGCPSDDYFVKMPVRYVHELQHAFRLAGIDYKIKLEDEKEMPECVELCGEPVKKEKDEFMRKASSLVATLQRMMFYHRYDGQRLGEPWTYPKEWGRLIEQAEKSFRELMEMGRAHNPISQKTTAYPEEYLTY